MWRRKLWCCALSSLSAGPASEKLGLASGPPENERRSALDADDESVAVVVSRAHSYSATTHSHGEPGSQSRRRRGARRVREDMGREMSGGFFFDRRLRSVRKPIGYEPRGWSRELYVHLRRLSAELREVE